MELLVLFLDPLDDLDRIFLVRRRHFDSLEAPLQRAVLLDRFAIFRRSRCANALDLAAGQCGLEYIGGIERPFRRPRPHQRVQLVDEHDGVLALHQLLHDRLQTLFKLPAILRPGHDQRQIQRQHPLVRQEARHLAVGNLLRQPLHNRRLAHAWLADQYRIVLRPPAQDLDHALDFIVAPNQRIELLVHGALRQVARKLRKQRLLAALPFAALLLRGLLLRRSLQFLADRRQAQPALGQDLRRKALLFAQQSQQQVFRADVLVRKPLGLFRRVRQHPLALVRERQIDRGRHLLPYRRMPFNLLPNRFH